MRPSDFFDVLPPCAHAADMLPRISLWLLASTLVMSPVASAADTIPINEDESKVPPYTLPDPLLSVSGKKIGNAEEWLRVRRPELLELFRAHVYGRNPETSPRAAAPVVSTGRGALGGKANRKLVRIPLTADPQGPGMDLLLYLPPSATGPVPTFLGLNFGGNHTLTADPEVPLTTRWVPNSAKTGVTNHTAGEASRGSDAAAWPVERILERGYALATVYYGDLEPDHPNGWKDGIRGTLARGGTNHVFGPEEWGAIGAWAWGLSRVMDYLETDSAVDGKRVAVMGHSRLGKTALWAGAQDPRFAVVISNQSGEGGAALARRWFGETVWRINTSFPHWFCGRFKDYNQNVTALPVDQHELIALSAPRPVYVGSAEEDRWADPLGEFLSAKNAEPVYALLGQPGLGVAAQPPVNTPVGGTLGYHIRTGAHALLAYDWEQYLNFADRHLTASPK